MALATSNRLNWSHHAPPRSQLTTCCRCTDCSSWPQTRQPTRRAAARVASGSHRVVHVRLLVYSLRWIRTRTVSWTAPSLGSCWRHSRLWVGFAKSLCRIVAGSGSSTVCRAWSIRMPLRLATGKSLLKIKATIDRHRRTGAGVIHCAESCEVLMWRGTGDRARGISHCNCTAAGDRTEHPAHGAAVLHGR